MAPDSPAIEGEPGLRNASVAAEDLAAAAELERLTRELSTDPCNLVRRACQLADYETVAAAGWPDDTNGR